MRFGQRGETVANEERYTPPRPRCSEVYQITGYTSFERTGRGRRMQTQDEEEVDEEDENEEDEVDEQEEVVGMRNAGQVEERVIGYG